MHYLSKTGIIVQDKSWIICSRLYCNWTDAKADETQRETVEVYWGKHTCDGNAVTVTNRKRTVFVG